jgi:hypothetical protein
VFLLLAGGGEISGINIDRVDGGKVVEEWASYDLLGAMRQLGAIS